MLQSLTSPSLQFSIPSHPQSHRPHRMRFTAAVQSLAEHAARKPASFYELLRVKQTASSLEIKAAYRSLAKIYHPDATAAESDACHFIEIHNAYETLSDSTARALYDLALPLGRDCRSSLGCYSMARRPTRRWETDQCW